MVRGLDYHSTRRILTNIAIVRSRSEIQHWLAPSNVADDLQKHFDDCMPGSCDWLLTTAEMQRFLSSKTSGTGHIQGRPGAGKSTSASFVINHLMSKHGPTVLFFFCNVIDVEKRQPIHVLRIILSQLLRADERLYPIIREMYIQSGRPTAGSLTEIEAALALAVALADVKAQQIFLVVDALDECMDVTRLVDSIARCMKSAKSTV